MRAAALELLRLTLCQVHERGVRKPKMSFRQGSALEWNYAKRPHHVWYIERNLKFDSYQNRLKQCSSGQPLSHWPCSTSTIHLRVNNADSEMMLGPASWQAPLRLTSNRPHLGRHILVFSRSISTPTPRDRITRRASWTPFKGWRRPKPTDAPAKPSRTAAEDSPLVYNVSPEVARAINTNLPIVALETTIYTHGFPYPHNVALALDLERIVRQNGAIPATIGVLDGVARVGLTSEEIVNLASSAGKPETMKVSRRDLPYILGMVCMTLVIRLCRAHVIM